MTDAKNNKGPYRSRPSEGSATTQINPGPFAPHTSSPSGETTIDRTDTQKGLTPVERAALELSMQKHRKALDLLARH